MSTGNALRVLALLVLLVHLFQPHLLSSFYGLFARPGQPAIYNQGDLLDITLSHLAIVAVAITASTAVALGLGIAVTRSAGAEFLSVSRAVANLGQTFPPVAVLAIAVPMLGFGTAPTLVALFLYGLLPVFENTLTGLTALPASVVEAARGMGMTPLQRLMRVELPLALPIILAGVRVAAIISLSTATIGSTVAARTLGEVIIAGLQTGNTAFVLQGGIIVGILAILIFDAMLWLERRLRARAGMPG